MIEQTLHEVSHRLTRIEKENRRWKILSIAALIALGLLTLLGASQAKIAEEVQTRQLTLLDKNGRIRLRAGISPDNSVGLGLRDTNSQSRAALVLMPNGVPHFQLLSKRGEPSIELSLSLDSPALTFHDEQDRTRVGLMMPPKGLATLSFQREAGKTQAVFGISQEKLPLFGLYDDGGQMHALLDLRADGSPRLRFSDRDGKHRGRLVMGGDGQAGLGLWDKTGKDVWRAP
jgi:hypothetical protein